jgi:hypothetical protein
MLLDHAGKLENGDHSHRPDLKEVSKDQAGETFPRGEQIAVDQAIAGTVCR